MSTLTDDWVNAESRIQIDIRQFKKTGESGGNSVDINLQVKECKSVILHPSFTCPAMLTAADPIRVYLLTDKNFHFLYTNGTVKEDASGWQSSLILRRTIARCLKINTFAEALTGKERDTENDEPLFDKENAEKNIAINYLGKAGKTNLKNKSGDEQFEAIIRSDAVQLYQKEGLTHIFQIDIHNHEKTGSKKGELYNIAWITSDPELKLHDKELLERQDEYTNKFIKSKKYIRNYDDIDDTELTHAFIVDVKDFTLQQDKTQPIRNYHPICIRADKTPLNIGQLTDVHVSSRQQAFVKRKAELLHGTGTNVIGPLVNTSFNALKDLMDQYGQDDKIDVLIFTGDLIDYNRNYHPKKFMDGTMSKTGELWQEMFMDNLNVRKADGSPQKDKDGFLIPNTDTFPSSIDNVIIYSLFLYYYKKYKKPLFLISGNHECYSLPYGISPRVEGKRGIGKAFNPKTYTIEEQVEKSRDNRQSDMAKEKENGTTGGNRANTGVPADHNLTFAEATLLYGPSYHQIVMFGKGDGSNTRNFKPQNLDWFYAVFSPLSDYSFSWDKQCFIGLEWGDGERMVVIMDSQASAGGILPRATESLTPKQEVFIKRAVNQNKPCTILLSHFTLVNYDQPIAINKTGEVDFSDFGPSHHGAYDYGTFEQNRKFLYQMLVEHKIHFALAGHSHRSALYQNTDVSDNWYNVRSSMQVNARTADPSSNVFDKTTYNPDVAKIIVSASGGSIPVQNYDNELGNWGLANPSGSYVYFTPEGKEQEIGIKTTNTTNIPGSQPRLAVALDFADVLGCEDDKIGGFFTRLESIRDDGPIYFDINPKLKFPDKQWIGEVTFYIYDGASHTPYPTTLKYIGKHKYEIIPKNIEEFIAAAEEKSLFFMSIKSNGSLNGKIYSQYNQDSPWQFRVKLEFREQRMNDFHAIWQRQGAAPIIKKGRLRGKSYYGEFLKMQKDNKIKPIVGLYIERHELFGETPDHRLYSATFEKGDEYIFNWGTKKSGDSK